MGRRPFPPWMLHCGAPGIARRAGAGRGVGRFRSPPGSPTEPVVYRFYPSGEWYRPGPGGKGWGSQT